jgi:hypothetical protein
MGTFLHMAMLWKLEGGLIHFERQFKDGYGNGASLSLWELCKGNLEGGLLYWGP